MSDKSQKMTWHELAHEHTRQKKEIERLKAENEGYREMLAHVRSERDDILRERNEFDKENERLTAELDEARTDKVELDQLRRKFKEWEGEIDNRHVF